MISMTSLFKLKLWCRRVNFWAVCYSLSSPPNACNKFLMKVPLKRMLTVLMMGYWVDPLAELGKLSKFLSLLERKWDSVSTWKSAKKIVMHLMLKLHSSLVRDCVRPKQSLPGSVNSMKILSLGIRRFFHLLTHWLLFYRI